MKNLSPEFLANFEPFYPDGAMKCYGFRLPLHQWEGLKALSEATQLNRQELVRLAIERLLKCPASAIETVVTVDCLRGKVGSGASGRCDRTPTEPQS